MCDYHLLADNWCFRTLNLHRMYSVSATATDSQYLISRTNLIGERIYQLCNRLQVLRPCLWFSQFASFFRNGKKKRKKEKKDHESKSTNPNLQAQHLILLTTFGTM